MLTWPLMAVEFHGVSSQTDSIKTIISGGFAHSREASACVIALSMSSCSYSILSMQELVQRKRNEFMATPISTSSGKAEQYVIPLVIEQWKGLPNISVVARDVLSNVLLSGDGIA